MAANAARARRAARRTHDCIVRWPTVCAAAVLLIYALYGEETLSEMLRVKCMGEFDVAAFRGVNVVPYTGLLFVPAGARYHCGGPIWPEFRKAGFARHHAYGKVRDVKPKHRPAEIVLRDSNLFWAGAICHHFGHQIMEFSMRLAGSRDASPNAQMVFAKLPDAPVPPFFDEIVNWFEIDPTERLIVDAPIRAQTLHVVPQAEQVHVGDEPPASVGPNSDALDRMDAMIERKKLAIGTEHRPIFLTRSHVSSRIAAEDYIAWAAALSGAIVVRPETLPLADQMALALSSRRLIITDGSALHLLSLAGRQFDTVHVLQRRPRQLTASASLTPRCRTLEYVNILAGCLCGLYTDGTENQQLGLAVPDEARLFDAFGRCGIDLRPVWDRNDFQNCIERDVNTWAVEMLPAAIDRNPESRPFAANRAYETLQFRPRFAASVRRAILRTDKGPYRAVRSADAAFGNVWRRTLGRRGDAKPRFPKALAD